MVLGRKQCLLTSWSVSKSLTLRLLLSSLRGHSFPFDIARPSLANVSGSPTSSKPRVAEPFSVFVPASPSLSLALPPFPFLCLRSPWVDILLIAAVVTTAANLNRNHRPRHQGTLRRQPLHLRVLPQTLAPTLHPSPHLPLRLQALMVLKDGHGPCLDSRRGSSGWPSVVPTSRKAATGGIAQLKRKRIMNRR